MQWGNRIGQGCPAPERNRMQNKIPSRFLSCQDNRKRTSLLSGYEDAVQEWRMGNGVWTKKTCLLHSMRSVSFLSHPFSWLRLSLSPFWKSPWLHHSYPDNNVFFQGIPPHRPWHSRGRSGNVRSGDDRVRVLGCATETDLTCSEQRFYMGSSSFWIKSFNIILISRDFFAGF